MRNSNDINQIINRFETGQETEIDRKTLFELLKNKEPHTLDQLAKYISNIERIEKCHIGDKYFINLTKENFDKLIKIIQIQGKHKSKFAVKNLTWLYSSIILLVFIVFTLLSLITPESAKLERVIISIVGAALFAVLSNFILTNLNSLHRTNQEIIDQSKNINFNIKNSKNINIFSDLGEYRYKNFLCLVLGTIFGLLIFFLSSSHYLFYIVDNSGSMGKCLGWNGTSCFELLSDSDETTVEQVKEYLASIFAKDNNLGSEKVSKSSLQLLPFYKFSSDVKVGLIEIGGKTKLTRQCITNVLTDPELNNKDKLLQSLIKIEANDDGITALVQALKKAENSIDLKTSNPLKYATSKNMILFTDGYEDNCGGNKRFCEAVSELPDNFNVELHVYGIGFSESKNECGEFKCTKYSANSCKPISLQKIRENKLPKLGLELTLSPILIKVFYNSLILTLIDVFLIIATISKNINYLNIYQGHHIYFSKIYLFFHHSTTHVKNIGNSIVESLSKEETIKLSRFKLLLIVFSIILIVLVICFILYYLL